MMANYTEQIANEIFFPNITVKKIVKDGVLSRYEAKANDGYVMYDPSVTEKELDPDTLEEKDVTYYRTVAGFPKDYNFSKFPYKTKPRALVDPKYIF